MTTNVPTDRLANLRLREGKLLRRIWRCSRNVVRSYERLEIKAKADPETYERPANILAYHVPKCRAEMSRIEKLLPDVRS